MELIYKEVLGFKFVKVGEFYLTDKPYPVTFDGKQDSIKVCIKLVDELFLNSDESAYLVYVEDEIFYVGEFSYSLKDRWLRRENYVWHGIDDYVEAMLSPPNEKKVSLWLTVDPYIIHGSTRLNISKSIEQEILRQTQPMPVWNKRGQLNKWVDWREKYCVSVSNIISKISGKYHPLMPDGHD